MNRPIIVLLLFLLFFAALIGIVIYSGKGSFLFKEKEKEEVVAKREIHIEPVSIKDQPPSIQVELEKLSNQMIEELNAERRLNLNLSGQLRSYEKMLDQVAQYADKVEQKIKIIDEIGKKEFQEDVLLQASLFNGKKPELVAKHLEEFRSSRVGAILAKMKEKEAAAVLDVWAKQGDPQVSKFYREVTAAYLINRRHDLHPELFGSKVAQEEGVAR